MGGHHEDRCGSPTGLNNGARAGQRRRPDRRIRDGQQPERSADRAELVDRRDNQPVELPAFAEPEHFPVPADRCHLFPVSVDGVPDPGDETHQEGQAGGATALHAQERREARRRPAHAVPQLHHDEAANM